MVNERTFGVEIECGTDGRGSAGTERLLRDIGLGHWARQGGVGHDGTEIEIRSPILSGFQGMKELKTVFNALATNRYYVTDYDGMHVHHYVGDLEMDDLIRIAESWRANQELIKRMVGPYRRNLGTCSEINIHDIQMLQREKRWTDQNGNNNPPNRYDEQNRWYYSRGKALNFCARAEHNTLEIRLHEGTLDFERARAWILFGQAFISNVAKRTEPLPEGLSLGELLRLTKTHKVAHPNILSRVGRLAV